MQDGDAQQMRIIKAALDSARELVIQSFVTRTDLEKWRTRQSDLRGKPNQQRQHSDFFIDQFFHEVDTVFAPAWLLPELLHVHAIGVEIVVAEANIRRPRLSWMVSESNAHAY